LMCIFPTRYYLFLPFVFIGLFVLMMHNCSLYITSTNEYLNWSICMLSASDITACYAEDAANSMSLIIFVSMLC
jgi:hypothetical protein